MTSSSLPLYVALGLLGIDSIIELSFVSSTVAWLHRRAGGSFDVAYLGSTYSLHGKPLHVEANHGHTANGAAGTAFVLIFMGGLLVLWMRSRPKFWATGFTKVLYHVWLVLTVLSALLTLAALIFCFVVNHKYSGQTIDQSVARKLDNRPYPDFVAYPLDTWGPENWFNAVRNLDLVHSSDRSNLDLKVSIMRGFRINLIPMFIIGAAVAVLAFWDAFRRRSAMRSQKIITETEVGETTRV